MLSAKNVSRLSFVRWQKKIFLQILFKNFVIKKLRLKFKKNVMQVWQSNLCVTHFNTWLCLLANCKIPRSVISCICTEMWKMKYIYYFVQHGDLWKRETESDLINYRIIRYHLWKCKSIGLFTCLFHSFYSNLAHTCILSFILLILTWYTLFWTNPR